MSERRVGHDRRRCWPAIGPVSMALFTPAMPEIVHAFGTTEAAVKMTLSLYFAGFAFAQLVCGPLVGRLRPHARSRSPSWSIYLVGSVLALLSPTIELLIVARFLQGVGAAVGVADFPRHRARPLHA